jgi:hypothetical protein
MATTPLAPVASADSTLRPGDPRLAEAAVVASEPSEPPGPGEGEDASKVGRPRVPWPPISLLILGLTGAAGLIAVSFATRFKPHVSAHLVAAYGLLGLMVVLYGRAHYRRRPMAAGLLWLTFLVFAAFVGFIHVDDVPGRVVYEGREPVARPRAPELWVAVGLDGLASLLLTAHLWVLGRRRRAPRKS